MGNTNKNGILKSKFVWAKGEQETMNCNLVFSTEIHAERKQNIRVQISAFNLYKLYINGKLVTFGPARSAKGYFRVDKKNVRLQKGDNEISVLVSAYNVANFSYVKDKPFFAFACEIDKKVYTATDFKCFDLDYRVKNAQRYSYQRGFAEYYVQNEDFIEWLKKDKTELKTDSITPPKKLNRGVANPIIKQVRAKCVRKGKVMINENAELWENRSIYQVGNCFEGYFKDQLKECLTDTVSKFVFDAERKDATYRLYDFSRNVSGFVNLKLCVIEDAEIYLTFDEMLINNNVDFKRMSCGNVIKWELKSGEYSLESIEPYTMRYCQITVKTGKVKIQGVGLTLVENSQAYKLKYEISDADLQNIMVSAQNTVAQNAFDVLMDCPSRERAGWINDIYFSRKCDELFMGKNCVLKNTLENYAYYDNSDTLPEKMVPMCYPAEHINGEYIPNCAIWYVIIIAKYFKKHKNKVLQTKAEKQIDKLLEFFKKYENEYGLLEDLESWIFIEWSIAGSGEYVCGVNFPSNMMYYQMFECLYEYDSVKYNFKERANALKKTIIEKSFNGTFFEDNAIREDGKLQLKGHISEACQYYAFDSGVADKESFPDLYYKLSNELTPDRNPEKSYPNVGKPNIIVGLLMRETMLLKYGEIEKALRETKEIYSVMAKSTKTLWEKVAPSASCNHGIAGYSAYIIVGALTGYRGYEKGKPIFSDNYAKIDCKIQFAGGVTVTVKDGVRVIDGI